MRKEESGVLPVWCPFYREDSGKSIFCEGITDESYGAINARYADA